MKLNKLKEKFGKKGISMFFALLLFLFMTVLGINLLNAVNAKGNNIIKEIEKQQTLLYVSSAFDVLNQMICDGSFYNDVKSEHAEEVYTTIRTEAAVDNEMELNILFDISIPSKLKAKITFEYQSKTYQIKCYYRKSPSTNTYILEKCEGLTGGGS